MPLPPAPRNVLFIMDGQNERWVPDSGWDTWQDLCVRILLLIGRHYEGPVAVAGADSGPHEFTTAAAAFAWAVERKQCNH